MAKNKILVVDDSATIVTIIKDVLQKEGYEVEEAFDGVVALEKAKTWKPDLILLDIVMPEMDGYAVLKQLRRDAPAGDPNYIPVIIMTTRDKMRGLVELEGIEGFIVKPFRRSELLSKLQEVLD